ncbi:MAG: thiamine biosynthesis protein ThiS [Deltaproteobacteria bacterium HGW-Deltaproteobacteria-17]|nr:MAG: thiamine biosynthesis protein ThiS [Deltaproteobacteria bacterium HGW-Deltaproteobacteria-17]
MKIIVNGSSREIGSGTTLLDLLRTFRDQNSLVVGELNGEVPSDENVALSEGDRVEIVTFVGGG